MSRNTQIALSAEDAVLAALALMAALDADGDDHLDAYMPMCPQPDAARASLIVPLIADMSSAPGGVEAVLHLIAEALPSEFSDTAYLLCAEYVATFGTALPEQMRLLERFGEAVKLDRLTRAALDRAALARSRALDTQAAD